MPWPFGHLGLKMLSVGFAVLLWLFVSGDEVVERGLRVPLEFLQFPDGLEMIGEPTSLVDVRVRGESGTLSRLNPADVVAQLDLKAARVGHRLYQLTPEQVRAPFGVQVVQVTPPSVGIVFEVSASKQVPVVPAVEGDPAAGYVVGTVTVDPVSVEVVGPASAIARVTQAVTEPVSVTGARATVNDGVTVGLLDPALRLKTPGLAQVRVEVMPGPVERTVRDRPVHLRNTGTNLYARATPNAVSVVLRGTREGVNGADIDEVVASTDLSGLGVGNYTLPVRVDAPAGAGVARVLPATIQVSIASGKQ
jgi:YbbR domain-containing protein